MTIDNRHPAFPVDPLFIQRWSPRAFTGADMPESDLLSMLEAAHWAPSAGNLQPWRFSYGLKGSEDWGRYVSFLDDGNQAWAHNAGALVIVVSKTHNVAAGKTEARFTRTHSFDTGAATMAIQLQAILMGYHAHPMGGILADRIKSELAIPDEGYVVEAAVAIGRIAPPETLPEKLRLREIPSQRKPLSDVAFRGHFMA